MPPPSLQSLARLGYRSLPLPPSILKYYSLWWAGAGPICFFIENGVSHTLRIGYNFYPLDEAFIYAARGGHLGLTELCKELGAGRANKAMAKAAHHGHEAIVRLCHEWGADDVNKAMEKAAHKGHAKNVRSCHEWGADEKI